MTEPFFLAAEQPDDSDLHREPPAAPVESQPHSAAADVSESEAEPANGPQPLTEPREGVPPVTDTQDALAEAVRRLANGTGPVAVDVERASAYRYGSRAYLIQLRRAGSGSFLIDPLPFDGLADLAAVLADEEWVLHAAHQDLPSLAGEDMLASRVFDTELAGRLLGYPRVSLGIMVADVLGFELEKGHSAADWSKRPLPEPWLRYAALDVELLLELRDAIEQELTDAGKLSWAQEEFAAIAASPVPPPRVDPWRRTSGMHRLRKPRQLAVVRELWTARDDLARERDSAPGRVLADAVIAEAALTPPRSRAELMRLPSLATARAGRKHADAWFAAVQRAMELPAEELPVVTLQPTGPPPPRSWSERDPEAAERLTRAREAMAAVAEEHNLPVENLLAPDAVRRLTWSPPADIDEATVAAFLRAQGAREWQIALTAHALARSLRGE